MFIYCLNSRTILIETALRAAESQCGRHNFTVMNETAHQILGDLYPKPDRKANCRVHDCTTVQRQRKSIKDWDEWQTDTMASVLSLPADFVRNALRYVGLNNGITVSNRCRNPKEYRQFCEAAAFLGSSKQALAIRMEQLGLLRREQCRAVSVYMDDDEKEDDIE